MARRAFYVLLILNALALAAVLAAASARVRAWEPAPDPLAPVLALPVWSTTAEPEPPPVTAPPTTPPSTTTTTRPRATTTTTAQARQAPPVAADPCAGAIASSPAPLAPGASERCQGNPLDSWGTSSGPVAWYSAGRWRSAAHGRYVVAHERGHLWAWAEGRGDWASEARADDFAARYIGAKAVAQHSPYR